MLQLKVHQRLTQITQLDVKALSGPWIRPTKLTPGDGVALLMPAFSCPLTRWLLLFHSSFSCSFILYLARNRQNISLM